MATIVERRRKDGTVAYLVQIIKRSHGFRESRSFPARKAAEAWAKKREQELALAIAEGRPLTSQKQAVSTLGAAIDRYIAESQKDMGKTKAQVLRTIRNEYDIANMRCEHIQSTHIVAFAQELHARPNVGTAATVMGYLSHLASVFKVARPMWGIPLDKQAMDDAFVVCNTMGITARSAKRERRPTIDELDRLVEHFAMKVAARPSSCPMHIIVPFAVFSTRRQEEITRLRWDDYEPGAKRILVRDMKNPGDKKGNHVWVSLPDPCCEIIDSMPRTSEYIFPYKADTIGASFTRACKALGINDLHFHDLRHEGTSRLFEMGYTAPLAASVTGHRSWSSLQRYTHINATGDKLSNWHWKVVKQ